MYIFSGGNIKLENMISTRIMLYYRTLVNEKKPKEIMGIMGNE